MYRLFGYNILEHDFFEHTTIDTSDKLYQSVCSQYKKNEHVYISLSGGVDSMVLTTILKHHCTVTALHVNYNNRKESVDEAAFLEKWCKHYNIEFKVFNMDFRREDIERNSYENETKRLRFQFYRDNTKTILLGHQHDDIAENVFTNIAQKKGILELNNMTFDNEINGVNIQRPLLEFPKSELYEYALFYKIPYFKDSTPEWSIRGKLRNIIFPEIKNLYNDYLDSLYSLGCESSVYKQIIHSEIIDKMNVGVKYKGNLKNTWIYIPLENVQHKHLYVLKQYFKVLLEDIGVGFLSHKSLSEFKTFIDKHNAKSKNLKKNISSFFSDNYVVLEICI